MASLQNASLSNTTAIGLRIAEDAAKQVAIAFTGSINIDMSVEVVPE
jgi:hypothetical protein